MTRARHSGMTMIELLVAMAIGVGVTLVVATLLVAGENQKRTTTSTNDADQTGSYAVHALDRALRGAGSGIAQSASASTGMLGCRLNAGTFLPRASAFPAPFSTAFLGGATNTLRLAPVLIGAGQSDSSSSDALVVMGASGTAGGVSRPLNGPGGSTSLILENSVGFFQYDLLLVSLNGTTDCLIEEVAATPTSASLTLTNNAAVYPYYTTGSTTTLSTLATNIQSYVTPLGNVGQVSGNTVSPNNVQFQMFGVGTNFTLYSYDLLQNQKLMQGGADTSQAIADGVIQMNAIYGVSTIATPYVFNHWANPTDSADGYDIVSVMNNPATQQQIMSVRVAIVVRGEYYDKNPVSPVSLTLFSGLIDGNGNSLAKTITISAVNQHYRYRQFEFTVPLRDMILLAGGA